MRSDLIKKGFDKAPHRSLLRATGQIKDDGDFKKPFIGIANSYIDLIPGHVHLQEFGATAKNAVRLAGGVPFEFNTIGVDDGIAMGHIGMRYSLASRELIADSVETVAESHRLDGLICISNSFEKATARPVGTKHEELGLRLMGSFKNAIKSIPEEPSVL